MYFLDLDDERIDAFRQGWGEIGDSIVVVGGDGLWNCHVHTNDIGAAIEVALTLDGRPKQIRVTDLFEEMAAEHAHHVPRPGAGLPPVTTAVVAVCSGDGLAELFSNLRVQGIVTGGQTLNPSTAELLDTVEHVNADQVVILPNNKNIIPVAEQVDALTSKTVVVVPTRTMPEALAALVVYDPEAPADENAAEMGEAIESVATGEVTQAVRDSNSEAGPIKSGDWMGIVRGDGIVAVAATPVEASVALLDRLITTDRELLTIITGSGADAGHDGRRSRTGSRCTEPTSRSRSTAEANRSTRTCSASSSPSRVNARPPITPARSRRDRRRPAQGRRRQEARLAGGVRHRHRARSDHHVPATLGRPDQRGPHRRPRSR